MVVTTCVELHGNLKDGHLKIRILKNNFDITVGTWEIAIDSLIARFNENVNTVVRCDFNCLQFFEQLDYERGIRHGTLNIFQLVGQQRFEIKTIFNSGQKIFKTFQSSENEIIFYFTDLVRNELFKKDVDVYMTVCFRRVE